MSSAFGITIFVALAINLPCVKGGFWNWTRWLSEDEPANCPSRNKVTNVCSSIEFSNDSCFTIKCCDDIANDESHGSFYNDSSGIDEESRHGGDCRLCYFPRTCALYTCYRFCCEGYEQDSLGICSNKTGGLQCENGGVLRYTLLGVPYCKCPSEFRGNNCEIPKCRCKNGGDCIVQAGRPFCNCTDGYYGDRCEKANCTLKCFNGGWCYKYGSNEFCLCPDRFIGDQCQQQYKNPDTCPLPRADGGTCQYQCSNNSHCQEDEVCCKEKCSSFCRKKKQDFCEYEGKTYMINAKYSPSPCKKCTCNANAEMVCYTISCAIPRCLVGEPETLPGYCCPSCPDKVDLPTISNCPTYVLRVNVAIASGSAILSKSITTIKAYDSDGNKLKVKYQPKKVYHCQCYDPKPIYVLAYTENDLGGIASCSFNITVKDPYPPRFNCSKDISVTEKTAVRWNEPSYEDNVGIGKISRPDLDLSTYKFIVGAHNMTYRVWDYDGNTASCKFTIYVERGLSKMNNCPAEAIRLNTSVYTNVAVIKQSAIGLEAYDFDNNKLLVTYQPQTVEHCKCSDSHKVTFNVSAMAVDEYGKVASCNFTVTVRDIIRPKILFCPSDIYVLEGDVVTWKDPVFVDNVGIAQNYVNMEKGTSYPVGRHTVEYLVKDYDRNEAYCRFEIIVDKAKPDPPKIQNCPVNVVQLNTSYMSDYAIVDNFNTGGISAQNDSGNFFQVKYSPEKVYHCNCSSYTTVTTTIFAEVVDSYGNKDSCQFEVVVKDIYKPVFTSCPSHIYVSENEKVTWQEPTYYDNVGVLDMSRLGYKSGQVPPAGNHTVYYKVWDYQYNTAVCKFNITVTKETLKPPNILNCPIKVLSLDTALKNDEAKMSEETTAIQAYDNDGKKLKVNYEPATVRHCHCFHPYTTETTVIAWAVDDVGVKETCEFNVTVSDKQAPVIMQCPEDMEFNESETMYWRQPAFEDNVAIAAVDSNYNNSAIFSIGKHIVYYNIWDYDFNNASCRFTLTVTRRKLPKIMNCPEHGLFLSTSKSENSVVLTENLTSIVAYDGDGNKLEVGYVPATLRHCYCPTPASSDMPVLAYAVDSARNKVWCTFGVFLLDEENPTIWCPGTRTLPENKRFYLLPIPPRDNVGISKSLSSGWRPYGRFPVGKHIFVREAWDRDGNYARCQFNIIVLQAECTLVCKNGGRCFREGKRQFCRCTPDYIGTQCEHKYTHPNTCPVPGPSNRICGYRSCNSNDECWGNNVCCKVGCTTLCRYPKIVYCKLEGQQYRVNDTYSPEPCTTCVCRQSGKMECVSKMCVMPKCVRGRQPVSRPDQCCLVCPGIVEEPKPRIYCPTHVVHVNTSYYTNMTLLQDTNTSVAAFNHFGGSLQVNYSPPIVHHCACDKPRDHVTTVKAYASDHFGNVATCSFQVVVRDIYAPVIFSCPENIYVFENKTVKWLEPNASDNVGIASKSCTSLRNGTRFPVGDYRVTCNTLDFDGNMASCNFHVSVTRKGIVKEPKPRIYCPTHVIEVNTSYYTNMTLLDDTKIPVAAFNFFGGNLQVNYSPPIVHHCECDKPRDHVTIVEAYASDHFGNVATCSFQVVVRDIYAPVISSCPEDINVFENETVKWIEPKASDNVGIASKSCTSLRNGTRFPVGDHRITCNTLDFDGNMASCNFHVSVTRKDTPLDDMPQEIRDRSTGEVEMVLRVILPSIFGTIVLSVSALLLLLLCRRKYLPVKSKKKPPKHPKTKKRYAELDAIRSPKSSFKCKRSSVLTYSSSLSPRDSVGRALAFKSNPYAVPGDIGIRPPSYSSYEGYSPTPYSVSGGLKDITHMSMPVPVYHNPNYETLSVHMSGVSGRSARYVKVE